MQGNAQQPAIIVSTCDAYADAWGPFLALFSKYWPDCPWPVYFVTNRETVQSPGVTTLQVGEDRLWASNLKLALSQIACSSVIYLQEDYFLQSRVNTTQLCQLAAWAERTDIGYIRLSGYPDPDLPFENTFGLGLLARDARYRCSLQAAWWNRELLQSLLVDGESGWEMEFQGTERSRTVSQPFLAVPHDRPLLDYFFDTAILKGKWLPGALRLCKREGISVDLSHRGVHPRLPVLWKQFRKSAPVSNVRRWFRSLFQF